MAANPPRARQARAEGPRLRTDPRLVRSGPAAAPIPEDTEGAKFERLDLILDAAGKRRMQPWSSSGLQTVPHLQWGSHFAHVFESWDELRDIVASYFKAGLENHEQCVWVTGEAFDTGQARAALLAIVPDLEERERAGQIEIQDGKDWYAALAKPAPGELVQELLRREQWAGQLGYAGLRTSGYHAWPAPDQLARLLEYETLLHEAVHDRRMICMCSYRVDDLVR